jgi:MinD-like ATPase involved in chromosome partitioning or flagellar assembly
LLSGEQTADEFGKITPAGMIILLEELATMADYVLLDVPTSLSEVSSVALAKCHFVNLVADPQHVSLSRVSPAVASLSKLGVERNDLGIVLVDRTGIGTNAELSPMTSIGGVPVIGIIPSDARECADAEARATPVVLAAPSCPVAVALQRLVDQLLSLEQLIPLRETNREGSQSGHG